MKSPHRLAPRYFDLCEWELQCHRVCLPRMGNGECWRMHTIHMAHTLSCKIVYAFLVYIHSAKPCERCGLSWRWIIIIIQRWKFNALLPSHCLLTLSSLRCEITCGFSSPSSAAKPVHTCNTMCLRSYILPAVILATGILWICYWRPSLLVTYR